jgi:mRNA interferase RelE/StbE
MRWSKTLTWTVEFDEAAAKELRKLDPQVQREILAYFRQRIATEEDPRRFGKPLSRELTGLWRYRVRGYRMICNIEDDKLIVLVVRVSHRKDAYT